MSEKPRFIMCIVLVNARFRKSDLSNLNYVRGVDVDYAIVHPQLCVQDGDTSGKIVKPGVNTL